MIALSKAVMLAYRGILNKQDLTASGYTVSDDALLQLVQQARPAITIRATRLRYMARLLDKVPSSSLPCSSTLPTSRRLDSAVQG